MERANGGALPDQYRHFLDLQTKKGEKGSESTNGVSRLTKLSQESVDPGWLRRGALTCALEAFDEAGFVGARQCAPTRQPVR